MAATSHQTLSQPANILTIQTKYSDGHIVKRKYKDISVISRENCLREAVRSSYVEAVQEFEEDSIDQDDEDSSLKNINSHSDVSNDNVDAQSDYITALSEDEDVPLELPCEVSLSEGDAAVDLRILTASREKPFACEKCAKSFSLHVGLLRHMKCHSDKPFACGSCGLRFRAKPRLERHVERHNGERQFQCQLCGKFFSSNWNLKAHMRLHTGEKPYKCSICSSTFTYQVSLHRHEITHTGERAYMCHACGKRFSMKDSLSKHLVIHARPMN